VAVNGTLGAEARQAAIAQLLEENGELRLDETTELLQVSAMTVRRDFDSLVTTGRARRVRGGVILIGGDDFSQRRHRHEDAKRQIAIKLRSLIQPNSLIAMDSSTTIHRLAETVSDVSHLSVVTNSLSTFEALRGREGIKTYLTGGEGEEQNISLVGSLAVLAVQQFNLDVSFLSAMSLDAEFGTSEMTLEQVAVKQAMSDAAAQTVLAVDSTKFNTRARFRSLPLQSFDVLVTELEPTNARLDPYRDQVSLIL
jgi:DeoR/GlpR family transcriptional regulator of sugar metabolism